MSTRHNDCREDAMTRERALAGRFRKKPVVIEAWQWDGHSTAPQRPEWLRDPAKVRGRQSEEELRIITLEGEMIATKGDWIIRGVKGEIYPCKPDVFAATYMPALASAEQEPAPAALAERREDELREDERLGRAMARAEAAEQALTAERQRRADCEAELRWLASNKHSISEAKRCADQYFSRHPSSSGNEPGNGRSE